MGIKRGTSDVSAIYRGSTQITKIYRGDVEIYSAGALDPDAQAFLTAAGITDETQESAVNQLVLDLKSAGIWTKMDVVWPIVGGTATAHKYNLVDPQDTDAAYRMTFNGTFTHNANGAKPTTEGGWGDTHWIPNSEAPFTNGVHWSMNVHTAVSGGNYNMGIAQLGDWALINAYQSGSTDYWSAGTGGYLTNAGDSPADYILGTSNGSDFRALYDDGVQVASNTTGGIGTAQTIPAAVWGVNKSDGPGDFTTDTLNFITIGDYLDSTEVAALNTAIVDFNTTLGR